MSPCRAETAARSVAEGVSVVWQGEVCSVHLAEDGGAHMLSPDAIEAIAGKGVRGDRYCLGTESGHFSQSKGARRQITLFENEVLETILRDHHLTLAPEECRMNVVTRGVPLTHLVGQRFQVGGAVLRGLQLNEPCARLNELARKRLIKALIHRCGLFAEILADGEIRRGDPITSLDAWRYDVHEAIGDA